MQGEQTHPPRARRQRGTHAKVHSSLWHDNKTTSWNIFALTKCFEWPIFYTQILIYSGAIKSDQQSAILGIFWPAKKNNKPFCSKRAKPHFSSQISAHKHTNMLTVPAAMGMENAEVQGHFKYSAAWGSPLSVHHILLLTHALRCTHMHTLTYTDIVGIFYTPHLPNAWIRDSKVPLRWKHDTSWVRSHKNSRRCEASMETQLSIFVSQKDRHKWMEGMTFEHLLFSVMLRGWDCSPCSAVYRFVLLNYISITNIWCWLIFSLYSVNNCDCVEIVAVEFFFLSKGSGGEGGRESSSGCD